VKSRIITAIPVFNGELFLARTLASVARQTRRPDRIVVLDNGSTDRTEEIVRTFPDLKCEFIRNPVNLGLFGNFNRCLDFAAETEYLQILHADDTLEPDFYEVMTGLLEKCDGPGLAWGLDARIDEHDQRLSVSGREDGAVDLLDRETFLQRKAEIGNQAFCATLMKTAGQPVPVRFPVDFAIVGDMLFWAEFGSHCRATVHIHRVVANYRWHSTNQTVFLAPGIQPLIHDEWVAMQRIESWRDEPTGFIRSLKLKGLFAVRSAIKARRVRQNGDAKYSGEIVAAARPVSGGLLWLAAQAIVLARDFYLFGLLGRRRHPKNIYG